MSEQHRRVPPSAEQTMRMKPVRVSDYEPASGYDEATYVGEVKSHGPLYEISDQGSRVKGQMWQTVAFLLFVTAVMIFTFVFLGGPK